MGHKIQITYLIAWREALKPFFGEREKKGDRPLIISDRKKSVVENGKMGFPIKK